jgi:hypothetical protein
LQAEQDILSELQGQLSNIRQLQADKARLIASTNELANAEREIWTAVEQTTQQMKETETIAQLLRDGVKATVIEAMQLSGVDMASPIDDATASAAQLASTLGIALQAAMRITQWEASGAISDEDAAMSVGFDNTRAAAQGRSAGMQYELMQSLAAQRSSGGGGSRGGRGSAERIAAQRERELEALVQSLMTERETVEAWRSEQIELLNQFTDAELAAIGGKNEAKLRLEQEYIDRMKALQDAERRERLDGYGQMFGDLASLMQTGNDKLFRIGQAAAIAGAVMDGWEAATSAWKWGMKVGGPPLAVAASAASLVRTGVMISNIASQSPRGTGKQGGGSGAPSSASGTTQQAQPERVVRINFVGPDWARDMVENMADQLFQATEDGTRVVIAR